MGVVDGPVAAYALQRALGLGRPAGKEDADIGRDPVADAPFALDPDEAGQVAPRPNLMPEVVNNCPSRPSGCPERRI